MEMFLAAMVLAILIEGTITYLFGESNDNDYRPILKYVSLVTGIIMASLYQVDILAALGVPAMWPAIGYITSGLIIGRGANYVNDFVSKIRE